MLKLVCQGICRVSAARHHMSSVIGTSCVEGPDILLVMLVCAGDGCPMSDLLIHFVPLGELRNGTTPS